MDADTLLTLQGGGPLHRRIAEAVRRSILSGRLAPGARLPPSRTLAEQLGVSRTPVLEAYAQLRAEGYVKGVTGSGTYVTDGVPDRLIEVGAGECDPDPDTRPAPPRLSSAARFLVEEPAGLGDPGPVPGRLSFRVGHVLREDFPSRLWRRVLGQHLRRMDHGYGPVEGHPALRSAVADYLARARAVRCDPEDVFIVAGARRGLDLVARLLLDDGDGAALEEPHYPGARLAFRTAGGCTFPVPVDDDGLDPAGLADLPPDVRLVYVTPSHQFPTGGVLPLGRRLELLDWAERTGAVVVEDDYDAEFQFQVRPVEALKGLDRTGRVVYVGTFSKVLSPDLRLGYLVVPPPLREPLRRLLWVTDRQCPVLLQGALATLFDEGHYGRHVRRMRRRHGERRERLLQELDARLDGRVRVQGSAAGVHVLVWFEELEARRIGALVAEGRRRGVELDPVDRSYLGEPPGAGVVLGYGGLGPGEIREGVARLAEALEAVVRR